MNALYQLALQKLGFRQQSYRDAFAGSAMQLTLVDLAKYSGAFDADPHGMSDAMLREMIGRRQMFFRILTHLKLSQSEMEQVYQPALVHAARRLQASNGDSE